MSANSFSININNKNIESSESVTEHQQRLEALRTSLLFTSALFLKMKNISNETEWSRSCLNYSLRVFAN